MDFVPWAFPGPRRYEPTVNSDDELTVATTDFAGVGNLRAIAMYNRNGGQIDGIESLIALARKLAKASRPRAVYFRGQADAAWGLRPTIGRERIHFGGKVLDRFTPEQEKNLLHRFRRHSYPHLNRVLNEWEALFLARHHSLPVRTLDWSWNPLVALYYACSETEHFDKPGAIWSFRRIRSEEHDLDLLEFNKSPREVKGVKILYPFYGSPRITAQSGVFTIQANPWRDLETYFPHALRGPNFDIAELTRVVIPTESKPQCIQDLEQCAINQRTLFPDLSGLAQGLWQTEVLRRGELVHEGGRAMEGGRGLTIPNTA